jgi:hypothetical protein
MSKTKDVEIDRPGPWVEPFAGLFARIRYQSWLVGIGFLSNILLGYWVFSLGSKASAHVYEVRDGETHYIGDRESNLAPRPSEAQYVAKRFVELIYGYNSTTVHQNFAAALSMCSAEMMKQYRKELAEINFIEKIRSQNIRSELTIEKAEITQNTTNTWSVSVIGSIDIYPLTRYEGSPERTQPFNVEVILGVIPRHPDRPSGLEVVRLVQHQKEI